MKREAKNGCAWQIAAGHQVLLVTVISLSITASKAGRSTLDGQSLKRFGQSLETIRGVEDELLQALGVARDLPCSSSTS